MSSGNTLGTRRGFWSGLSPQRVGSSGQPRALSPHVVNARPQESDVQGFAVESQSRDLAVKTDDSVVAPTQVDQPVFGEPLAQDGKVGTAWHSGRQAVSDERDSLGVLPTSQLDECSRYSPMVPPPATFFLWIASPLSIISGVSPPLAIKSR